MRQLPVKVFLFHIDHLQVSWLRWSDMSVLTVGGLVFSSDPRLLVTVSQLSSTTISWKLFISDVSGLDSGDYQCQINTEPKQSLDVTLLVTGKYRTVFLNQLGIDTFLSCVQYIS